MPVPFVNVGNDVLKAWMAGKQMAMAQNQMMMEQQRLQQEREHQLTMAGLEAQRIKNESDYQTAMVKHAQDVEKANQANQEVQQGKNAKEEIQKGQGGTSFLSTPSTDSPQAVSNFASQIPVAPTPNPVSLPQSITPTAQPSPGDLTNATANMAPTSPQTISGNGPQVNSPQPLGPPTPAAPIQGPAPVIAMNRGQDIKNSLGHIILSAEDASSIVPNPPMSERDKLQAQFQNESELQNQRLAADEIHWQNQYDIETKRANMEAARFHEEAAMRKDMFGMQQATRIDNIAKGVVSDPKFSKQLSVYGPLGDYLSKAADPKNPGQTSPIEDAEAMNALSVAVGGTPLAGLPQIKAFADSLKTTPDELGNKIKSLVGSGNTVLLSTNQKIDLAHAIDSARKNIHNDYSLRFSAAQNQAKQFGIAPENLAPMVPFSGILGDYKEGKK